MTEPFPDSTPVHPERPQHQAGQDCPHNELVDELGPSQQGHHGGQWEGDDGYTEWAQEGPRDHAGECIMVILCNIISMVEQVMHGLVVREKMVSDWVGHPIAMGSSQARQ